MEIIHLILGRANPNRMNGVNRVVHNLATNQVKIGHKVSVWGITKSYNKPDEVKRSYQTRWFQDKGRFTIDEELKQSINDTNIKTVFHFHGGFIPVYYSLSKFVKKAKRKYFFTPHGTYTKGAMQGNNTLKSLYFKYFEKSILKKASCIQCLGHAEETDLKKLFKRASTTLIPNGQNWEELKLSYTPNVDDKFIIGYCGRISKWHKGLDVLIESFSRYKQYYQGKGQLSIIGDGPYLEEMKSIAVKNHVDKEVNFWGKQFGQEKIEKLLDMKVFVHTSRNEGLPTAVIEAASLSIPCLVTEMTSMDRYILNYDAGWKANSLDVDHIARLFLEVENEYLKNKLIKKKLNVYKMAQENFDWSQIASQTIVMYVR